jgi:hypothetical protein
VSHRELYDNTINFSEQFVNPREIIHDNQHLLTAAAGAYPDL